MTLNIAHRGGAGLLPENTMAAFENAFALGADGVELDVQLTRDDVVAVFHDFALKPEIVRDAQGHWLAAPGPRIGQCDFADLQAFDIGRLQPGTAYAAHYPAQQAVDGQRVPALRDVLAAAKRAHKRIWIELKTPIEGGVGQEHPHKLAEAVLALLAGERALDLVTLCAFDWAAVAHAKRREPGADVRFLTIPQRYLDKADDMPWCAGYDPRALGGVRRAIKAAGGDGWYAPFRDLTEESAAECRALGLSYAAWTVNEIEDMRRLHALGCDAICSDRPDLLRDVLRAA